MTLGIRFYRWRVFRRSSKWTEWTCRSSWPRRNQWSTVRNKRSKNIDPRIFTCRTSVLYMTTLSITSKKKKDLCLITFTTWTNMSRPCTKSYLMRQLARESYMRRISNLTKRWTVSDQKSKPSLTFSTRVWGKYKCLTTKLGWLLGMKTTWIGGKSCSRFTKKSSKKVG